MINLNLKNKLNLYQLIAGLGMVTLILLGCIIILKPLFPAFLLATIFTLATWPAFALLQRKLRDRPALAATLMTALLAGCFVVPLLIIGTSVTENFTKVYGTLQDSLQNHSEETVSWLQNTPYVGHWLERTWLAFDIDKEKLGHLLQDNVAPLSRFALSAGKTVGYGLLDLTLGVLISYFFFRHGMRVAVRVRNLIDQFGGPYGQHLLGVSKNTLVGVVYGILGTAVAQGALAAFGFWLANVPGASFLGLMTFFLAFVPVGAPLVWLPVALWLFSENQMIWGGFMILWGALIIGSVDNLLRPYFISRGSNLPFLLVLLGILGGMMAFGFIGIFIGPTLIALAYSLMTEWSSVPRPQEQATTAPPAAP
jgi:predicted PurR-regulated permease PerM